MDPLGRAGHRPGRYRLGLALAAAVAAAGGILLGVGLSGQQSAPQPPQSAAGVLGAGRHRTASESRHPEPTRAAPRTSSSRPAAVHGPHLPRSQPTRIDIAAIGVHSALITVGVSPDGTLQVPQPGPDYNKAAWFSGSPTPGQVGPSLIEGHIDSAAEGPSVFFRLGQLRPGDEIQVHRQDGRTAIFRVTGAKQYPKTSFPTERVYRSIDHAGLRLVTCGGKFDSATGNYLSDILVFADLVRSTP